MALSIRELTIFLVYAIGINIIFASLSNLGVLECSNVSESFLQNDTYAVQNITDDVDTKTSANNFISLILNRCDGFPAWIYWMFQVPLIIGLLYIIRGFIGVT